jgi:hypothetical protein
MEMEKKQSRSGGAGFMSLLQVLFIGLKLGEVGVVADWSWWTVLSPIWGTILFVLALAVIVGIAEARK